MTKKISRIVLGMIVVLLIGTMMIGCSAKETFVEFTPEDKSFTVEYPGTPEASSVDSETAVGTLAIDTYLLENKKAAYNVSVTVMPEEVLKQDEETLLSNSCNGAIASSGGTDAKIVDDTIDGVTAKYITYNVTNQNGQNIKIHHKIFLNNGKLYQLQFVSNKEYKEDRERFFASFKLAK